jgi:bifunctional non-homologous end joining protein LigD
MLARSGPLPDGSAHAFEFKWDGMRAIVTLDRGRYHVQSRNGHDFTANYPELQVLADATKRRGLVLDGEIVAPGSDGRPSFELLATRIRRRPRLDIQGAAPICLMLFDVLAVDGRDMTKRTYTERRRVLDGLQLNGPAWKTPLNHIGDGEQIRAVSRQHRLEGVVAKRLDSIYEAGKRSGAWIKIKNHCTGVYRVGGWIADNDGRVEAVLIGKPASSGMLQYVGAVELGCIHAIQPALERLACAETSFHAFESRRARPVKPELSVVVRYLDTDDRWPREATLITVVK